MSNAALSLRNVSKSYRLFGRRSQFQTLKSALLKRDLRPPPEASIPALRNVSFDVERGEAFGIIGRNGSGKSTLLKIISGILKPTSGTLVVDGRVSALIELGAGFHPEISGRENVYINGIMLGLTRREIDKRFDQIAEFSGIRELLDQPVKTYSSGMYVRLGFAVAVHVDPDILLIDEVLSVGDEEFSQKCVARIQELKYRGVTMLVVTHQLDLVRALCDRALWLDHGVVERVGEPIRVVDAYLQRVAGEPGQPEDESDEATGETDGGEEEDNELLEEERWGSGEVLLARVLLYDRSGHELVALGPGSDVEIEMEVKVREAQTDFVFGIGIYHADGTCVYGTNTDLEGFLPERLENDARVRFVIPSLDLVAGSYRIDAAVHTRNGRAFDYRRGVIRFVVGSRIHDIGVYRPKHEWSFEGGVELRQIDLLSRNVPAPMAEYIRENENAEPSYRKRPRRRRKKKSEEES
ncbi:MAG TPA: ABC transporter ATP-binding protein [Thermoanaerobaculia bacterium]|nr:ABC transporter ATP-binding protein [Thermoanaerobaculia bacterium]